jgi:hypothetical protein
MSFVIGCFSKLSPLPGVDPAQVGPRFQEPEHVVHPEDAPRAVERRMDGVAFSGVRAANEVLAVAR